MASTHTTLRPFRAMRPMVLQSLRNTSSSSRPQIVSRSLRKDPVRPLPIYLCERCRLAYGTCQRTFSTSATQKHTALLNPRYNENGEEMVLDLTSRAAHRLSQIKEKDKNPDLALRVTVESGGCHGFQYLMSLTNLSSNTDQPRPQGSDDTVFEGAHGAKVILDESSLELLQGSKVDYTMELIGSQFKITGNPRASSSCGCGTSFDIKID